MSTAVTASSPALQPEVKRTSADNTGVTITTKEEARVQLNASIVTTSFDVAISSGNEPLALLYKSAINSINVVLKQERGDNAIQNAFGQDNTPEGTAGRIVSISTGFYEAFKRQHPGENEADVLSKFMSTIKSGFERGYQEASDILQGLGVLDGDIKSGIEKTFKLVQQGYADFEAAQRSLLADATAQDGAATSAPTSAPT
ncbi:MAG: hypothetical protein H6R17_87 [Proteobacteria bacterium]|nr:hypothetical protein [Pseudomonadota bacterium]